MFSNLEGFHILSDEDYHQMRMSNEMLLILEIRNHASVTSNNATLAYLNKLLESRMKELQVRRQSHATYDLAKPVNDTFND